MTLGESHISLVLLDIEGTTTPVAFVYDVLFPFGRAHLGDWLQRHWTSGDGRAVANALASEHAIDRQQDSGAPEQPPADPASAAAYATWLLDRDRKSYGLKLLQGLVCQQGYRAGELRGEVYADVPRAFRRWRDANVSIAIYSSGSELAQRLLFASLEHGDLTPLIDGFFDTRVGAKIEPQSYRRIADALNHQPSTVLFVSDVTRELAAARSAGCQTLLMRRPGSPPQPNADAFQQIRTFDEL